MTSSYTSEIAVGSAIIAVSSAIVTVLGAAYMVFQRDHERPRVFQREREGPSQQMASAIHANAWGKQWPRSEDTIYKNEISDETGSVDDDDDEVYDLADKLVIPSQFNYRFFKEIRGLKTALGAIIWGGSQLLLYVGGMGGTGKTHLIRAVVSLFDKLGRKKELQLSAPTGAARVIIHSTTIHSLMGLPNK